MENKLKKIKLKKIDPALAAKVFFKVREEIEKETLFDNINFVRGFWRIAAAIFLLLCGVNVYMSKMHEDFMIKQYHACKDRECKMEILAMSGVNSSTSALDARVMLKNILKSGA